MASIVVKVEGAHMGCSESSLNEIIPWKPTLSEYAAITPLSLMLHSGDVMLTMRKS